MNEAVGEEEHNDQCERGEKKRRGGKGVGDQASVCRSADSLERYSGNSVGNSECVAGPLFVRRLLAQAGWNEVTLARIVLEVEEKLV